ncbi:serine/threonine protein kinase [Nitrospira defluvii]|nr:serine/threonine protein kinase [Nitrospira defluvii]
MKKIGNYDIIAEIGKGGMSVVYKGLQASLNRPVAIKLLSKKVSGNKEIVERFNRESLIIARLMHPNIIHVIDRGITEEGAPFFIMDFVEGTTLAEILEKNSLASNRKFDLIIQICKGLSYAHKNGVVHRDIKPANILIDVEGNAILTDFGIARFSKNGDGKDKLTREGSILGTPSYMSPEQKTGLGEVTAESDLYSLGVIMYEMFTGSNPLGHFKPPSELACDMAPVVEEVILKCLSTKPSDRFHSADEVKDQLLKVLRGEHLGEKKKERALERIQNLKNRFVLLDVISENRFGAVHLLEDLKDDALMVVKKCRHSREWAVDKRKLTHLRHKNIAKVFGSSEDGKYSQIVMEYVSGGSLKDRMVKEYAWHEVLSMSKRICEGLAYAHMHGLIHGNIRPSNILIDESGNEKIADFGLEEHYYSEDGKKNWYSPPGEEPSYQADIYGVGVIIYELLFRSRPIWKLTELIPHEGFGLLPLDLQSILSKMIARKREKRYRNLDEVIHVIDALLEAYEAASFSKNTVIKKGKRRNRRRTFLFLTLLALSAAYFYIQYTQEIHGFLEPFFR